MVPTVYIENENDASNLDAPEHIFEQIAQKNKDIIEKTESGSAVKDSEYAELQFNVGKLDINILPDSYVNVYDIPGLNDARTKTVYYKYLERNFSRFNLVVFIVDIHSGLNTSDEADILNFIADHTRQQLEANNKKIYTLVVVNKADDMQLIPESEEDELEITGELGEMFSQVENTVSEAFNTRNISEHLVGIIPLCAIDAYLYRMTQKHGDRFKLSPEQILKIGINENGKKFSTLKPKTQEAKVREILNDKEFVDTMIKLSGFGHFEKRLHVFMQQNDTGKRIRIENLMFSLNRLASLGEFTKTNPTEFEKIAELCSKHMGVYNSIARIDAEIGRALIISALADIEESVKNQLKMQLNHYESADKMAEYYDKMRDTIFIPYFEQARDWSFYPEYLCVAVIESATRYLLSAQLISSERLMLSVKLYEKLGVLTCDTFGQLIASILQNYNKYSGLIQVLDNSFQDFVLRGKGIGVDMKKFLRFVVLDQLCGNSFTEEQIYRKLILYQRRGETQVHTYLQSIAARFSRPPAPQWFLDELNENDPFHALDLLYLSA